MLVFWKQNLVFLATPKAGSTAIQFALEPLASLAIQRPAELNHTPFHRYESFLKPYLEKARGRSFETVALVRNPLDWLGSWYRSHVWGELYDDDHDPGFATFVEKYLDETSELFARIGTQSAFLAGHGGARVDHLFRYEDLGSLLAFLEDRLDCAITLPQLNVFPTADVTIPPALKEAFIAAHQLDYALHDSAGLVLAGE